LQVDPGTMALVVAGFDAKYPDQMAINVGQELTVMKSDEWPGWLLCQNIDGKQGWVPEKIVKITGGKAVAQQPHDAHEISMQEGEIVRIERIETGRAWVTDMTNETGWVPLKNLKIVE
jgi:uncharacterized protein YgiM (DUF1202 family)